MRSIDRNFKNLCESGIELTPESKTTTTSRSGYNFRRGAADVVNLERCCNSSLTLREPEMLSDARSIWSSISNAATTINDNISTALENKDHESNGAERDHSTEELQIYKKLLDEAQMHHVDLSQASRVLIAEKDAELKYWKKKSGADDVAVTTEGDPDITMDRLIEERDALQETLILLGAQLRDSLRESNEAKVLTVKFKESQDRYEAIKTDFRKFSAEVEMQNKHKNDTIENLVAEYSKLVTESFHRQNGDAVRYLFRPLHHCV
jgi:hypothetical protein